MYLKHDSIALHVVCNTQALATVAMVMVVGLTGPDDVVLFAFIWFFAVLRTKPRALGKVHDKLYLCKWMDRWMDGYVDG